MSRATVIRSNEGEARNLGGLMTISLVVGIVGLLVTAAGGFLLGDIPNAFRAYHIGYLFWVGLSLGSIGLMLLHNLAGGGWGMLIRRIVEAGARTTPFMGLLFIPIVLGMSQIFGIWVNPDPTDQLLAWKAPYLNVPFFLGRTVAYFLLWSAVAYLWSGRARRHDEDPSVPVQSRTLSGLATVAVSLAATFALFDWVMSLEPHWFSSIFSASIVSGMMLATFAFSIIITAYLSRTGRFTEVFSGKLLSDVGSLMMAFTLIWAYLNFSQLVIQYAANLPEEMSYYLKRNSGGWQIISVLMIVGHFALPFVMLMSNAARRSPRWLAGIAAFVMLMNMLYYIWLVRPAFDHGITSSLASISWMDATALIGVGGIWLALFFWQLNQKPLVPALAVPELVARAHAH